MREALLRDDPDNARRHRADIGLTHVALAQLDWKAGRWPEAKRAGRKGLDLLEAAVREGPPDVHLAGHLAAAQRTVGSSYWEIGLWDEAADLYRQSFVHHPPGGTYDWHYPAYLLLYRGDLPTYRRHCEQMLKRFAQADEWVGRTCTVGPDAAADMAEVVRRAEQDRAGAPTDYWRTLNLAMAYCRAGRFDDALRTARDGSTDDFWAPHLAVVVRAAGRTDEAREWLRKADGWHERIWREALAGPDVKPPSVYHMHDLVRFEVVRREAHQLIDGKPPPDDPWQRLHLARVYFKLGSPEKAEAALKAAVAARPDDPDVLLTRGRLLAGLDMKDRAETDFIRAGELKSSEPLPWIRHGHFLAESGRKEQADAAFARAAAMTPGELNRFLEAGWWVAGPYPADLRTPYPPERDADPSRPAAAGFIDARWPWQPVTPDAYGKVDLGPVFNRAERVTGYALTYVWSPEERPATLLVGADDTARVWLNGRLVHETPSFRGPWAFGLERVPVTLRAGRNMLLVKVGNITGDHYLYLRLADGPFDRGLALAELGLWPEAAAVVGKEFERGLPEDRWLWWAYALLLQAAGDTDGYRHLRTRVVERIGRTRDGTAANILAAVCNLAPDAGIDSARLVDLHEQWLKAAPRDVWRLQRVGITRLRAGQYKEAMQRFEEARSGDAGQNFPLLAMTCWHLDRRDEARAWLAKADEWYEKAVKEASGGPAYQPVFGPSWWELATFQVLRREAKELIEGKPPKDDPNGQSLQAAGRELLKKRDRLTADFDHALALQPDQPRLWQARGERLAGLKRWDAAAADFDRWLSLVAEPHELWWGDPAALDGDLGRWDEVFTRVAERRPKEHRLWVARARHLGLAGRWEESAAALAKATTIDPSDHFGWYSYAALLLERGRGDDYRRVCREMLTRFAKTDRADVADRTAKTCLLVPEVAGDKKEVMRLAERAVTGTEGGGSYRWFQVCRALAHCRAGEPSAAAERLKAVTPSPDGGVLDATAFVVLALAEHQSGRADEAREALRRADAIREQKMPRPDRGESFDDQWPDWLRFQILRREAGPLLEGTTVGGK